MPSAILAALSNLFSLGAAWIGFSKQRDGEKNTASMQAGAIAAQEQKKRDEISATIANQDVEQQRKDMAQ